LGLTPPLSLIFYNNFITCAKEVNWLRISFANGQKSNNYVLAGIRAIVCVQKPHHHFLQTLRPLRMF